MDTPIPFSDWPKVLADVTGTTVGGETRIATAELMALVGATDRVDGSMRIKEIMAGLGWTGPWTMRLGGRLVKGYFRAIEPQPADQQPAPEPKPPEAIELPAYRMPQELSQQLERTTSASLSVLEEILAMPNDGSGNVLRAKTAAAGIAVNAQLRADESRLRAARSDDTLEKLLAALKRNRRLLRPKKTVQAPAAQSSAGG